MGSGTDARWAVNLTVHGIGRPARPLDPGEDDTWITVEQLDGLLDAAVGRPEVTITFDDGNLSDLEIGLPRLQERGLRARFYVCAGLLGQPGRLDAADVRELHAAGMVIGSHGWSHRDWRSLDWSRGEAAEVQEEMVRARRELERLTGSEVSEIAIPFGSYNRHVLRALRRTGATRVYTSDGGWARRGAWLQARTSIRSTDGPDWPQRVMIARPTLGRRVRNRVAGTAKRLRG
ncbi:polysaccharide deacetylase family protein [Nocardioides sp. MAH-18]|uniref:Polysaccharide deacetylase family protein n=1 Tax=Nocardioides agri TaxID=2682843 RepID=A0A6L6XQ22_9ACTN|nr:polysaccharide deacetylase family protein [Nocardioides sp. CGMCC 1.13656]MVQ49108.1 polysaccharide deacetylase family protein [Nocardioides sp. MAH-18]